MKRINSNIYVVGYPKSGNTWVTRLLARAIQIPAGNGMGGNDDAEIATDVNKFLSSSSCDSNFRVRKSHLFPQDFLKLIDLNPKRIVYVIRDIKDVTISSYFYFKYIDDDLIRLRSWKELRGMMLLRILKYIKARYKFNRFVKKMSGSWDDQIGCWADHIKQWHQYLNIKSSILSVVISYEELSRNPKLAIEKILDKLELSLPLNVNLDDIVENESFSQKKESIKRTDDASIPMGKGLNLHHLRKGVIGDWKNYLTKKQENYLDRISRNALAFKEKVNKK